VGKKTEVTAQRPDGSRFPAEIAVTAADIDGPPVYIASLRDLTEQKKAEAEREELNKRLLTASRHAGMAEVATGVLHNVGNVLNSVNVSANVVAGKIRESELPSLAKVSQMLSSRREDLASFLTADERGKLVPSFIEDLAKCLSEEQSAMLSELATLSRGIEHIKEIVSSQQSLAKRSTVLSDTEPAKLIESALTMQTGSLERHGIEVVRRFESNEPAAIDTHKVLQILINLINNARQSVIAAGGASKRITLVIQRFSVAGEKRLRFQVIDTGNGIAAEHLTRIFSHGFTTKQDGHGFGLHSAANAAKEMRGSLTVASEGPVWARHLRWSFRWPISKQANHADTEPTTAAHSCHRRQRCDSC
jgi:signal transduction histidine kinase